GRVFTSSIVLPVGECAIEVATHAVFSPQSPPDDYAVCVGTAMALRSASFRANALDIGRLKPFLARQSRRYGEISAPGGRHGGRGRRSLRSVSARTVAADERDPQHVGRARRAEGHAGGDDDALAGLRE